MSCGLTADRSGAPGWPTSAERAPDHSALRRPERCPQRGEKRLLAELGFDRVSGLAIDARRTCAPVAPHPAPCNTQERRVSNEIEEVDEPTIRIVGCPPVQLGLHPQYPRLRL